MITLERYFCINCGKFYPAAMMPYLYDDEIGFCDECAREVHTSKDATFDGKEFVDMVIAPFLYEGAMAKAIKRFKFDEQRYYGEFLTEISAEKIKNSSYIEGYDLIVPVPLHKKRLNERGYNQAEIIAKKLSCKLDIPFDAAVLVRTRNTEHQSRLRGLDRINNVKDAFKAQKRLDGVNVILVDDIYTMGETANACAEALKIAGANKVTAFAICKTVGKKINPFLR